MLKKIIYGFTLFSLSLFVFANDRTQRESLDKVYIVDKIRIFYTLTGENALQISKQIDLNDNSIPDYVEAIASNLKVADLLFSKTLGLTQPLQSQRYRDKVDFIDVHIMTFKKHFGLTSSTVETFNYKRFDNKGFKSISIKLSNDLNIHNLTPVHELFHEYQSGYAMFINQWYLEGLARWSEFAFINGFGPSLPLPESKQAIEEVIEQSYAAKFFWNRLTEVCDSNNGRFHLDSAIKKLDQVGIIKDTTLHGYSFIRQFFENLKLSSLKRSNNINMPSYNWGIQERKSNVNNAYILCSIKKTVQEQCQQSEIKTEIDKFINALDQYTENTCNEIL